MRKLLCVIWNFLKLERSCPECGHELTRVCSHGFYICVCCRTKAHLAKQGLI